MRTIKFRGKASHNGEWLYGDLINIHGEHHILGEDDMREDGHHVTQDSDRPTWVNPDTIGQFTGLYDKNGKEIYDGDIIEKTNRDGAPTRHIVVWKEDEPQFTLSPAHPAFFCEHNAVRYTVIGNIHDNAELMEGGER